MRKSTINFILWFLLLHSSLSHALDTVKVNEKDGLFSAYYQTAAIVSTNYIGWRKNWQWSGPSSNPTHLIEHGQYAKTSFKGEVHDLDVKFDGSIIPLNDGLAWDYHWRKETAFPDAIGYGIEFSLALANSTDAPELLPNNSGWRWTLAGNKFIEVTFSPALAKIHFEKGNKGKIRAFFFSAISKGSESSKMTVKVSENVKVSGPDSMAYKSVDSSWRKGIMSSLASPIDLSFLNKDDIPAGKNGFIQRKGDELFFENGQPAKFWGANIQAYTLFKTSDFDIKRHAKRIAKLGFNLIRIHHHDSGWVTPNIFKNPNDSTLEFSESSLKKIDWWVKCLKDEGVYLWLDLHVGRRFTKKDGIKGFSDFAHGAEHSEAKGFSYYNKDVQSLMMAFNKAYLSHVNPHTKLAYKDDPAVIALLLTNENDVTHHFGNSVLADKNVPFHHDIFTEDTEKFASDTGLSKTQVRKTWLMGESKIYLNDVEHRFNQKMIGHLDTLGVKSLIATTNNWGDIGVFGLPSLTDGGIIDVHSYGKPEEFKFDPRHTPGFLSWVGGAQVTGYPLSITEWNIEPFPTRDRFTSPLFISSVASLQGWDAIMLYGYSQDPLSGSEWGKNYSSYNDPAIMGLMPAAALLYRQGHVSLAKNSYELKLSREDFFFKRHDPRSSKTIRTLLETSRLTIGMPNTPELPWLKPAKASGKSIVIKNANQDFIPVGQNFVESDTKELKRDWGKGVHTINTAKSQVVSGWVGGDSIDLTDVKFTIKTDNAVVAVQSVDDKPIRQSNKIFITVMARSKLKSGGQLPYLSEPVNGKIAVYAPEGMRLYPVNKLGKLENQVDIQRDKEGKYTIDISSNHWFILQNTKPSFEVTIVDEKSEGYVEGELVTFRTNTSQVKGKVSEVKFWSNDKPLKGVVKQASYKLATRTLPAGKHVIRSRAIFDDGTHKETNMTLTVQEAPFRITFPYDKDKVVKGKSIVVKTNADKWSKGIQQVNFWKDEWKYLGDDKTPPYELKISDLSVGEHVLRSRIMYKDGKMDDSFISITVVDERRK